MDDASLQLSTSAIDIQRVERQLPERRRAAAAFSWPGPPGDEEEGSLSLLFEQINKRARERRDENEDGEEEKEEKELPTDDTDHQIQEEMFEMDDVVRIDEVPEDEEMTTAATAAREEGGWGWF